MSQRDGAVHKLEGQKTSVRSPCLRPFVVTFLKVNPLCIPRNIFLAHHS